MFLDCCDLSWCLMLAVLSTEGSASENSSKPQKARLRCALEPMPLGNTHTHTHTHTQTHRHTHQHIFTSSMCANRFKNKPHSLAHIHAYTKYSSAHTSKHPSPPRQIHTCSTHPHKQTNKPPN